MRRADKPTFKPGEHNTTSLWSYIKAMHLVMLFPDKDVVMYDPGKGGYQVVNLKRDVVNMLSRFGMARRSEDQ